MMSDEDADYYAETLTEPQREVILGAQLGKWTLLTAIAETGRSDQFEIGQAADFLAAANLLEKRQSKLGGQYFHNVVMLNERGVCVQNAAISKRSRKSRA